MRRNKPEAGIRNERPVQFQVADGWIYILTNFGNMMRAEAAGEHYGPEGEADWRRTWDWKPIGIPNIEPKYMRSGAMLPEMVDETNINVSDWEVPAVGH